MDVCGQQGKKFAPETQQKKVGADTNIVEITSAEFKELKKPLEKFSN